MNGKMKAVVFTAIIFVAVFTVFMVSASESEGGADKAIDPSIIIISSKAMEEGEDSPPILLKSRQFVPTPGIEAGLESNMSALAARGIKRRHVLIQFEHIPSASERENLENNGIDLQTYISKNAWFARVKMDSISKIEEVSGGNVRWVGEILPADKIAPHIKEVGVGSWAVNPDKDGSVNILVTFFDDVSAAEAREVIVKYGNVMEEPVMSNYWRVTISESDITNLAGEDAVLWIQEVAPPKTVNNDGSRAAVGANTAQAPPYNLNGSGVVIGEWDGGWADGAHNDLSPRVTVGDPASPTYPNCSICALDNHATHIAGTAMGDGTNSAGLLRGMATLSNLFTYEWPYTINEMDIETKDAIVNHNAVISTNSWGWLIEYPDCWLHGYYCSWSQNYDDIVGGKLGDPITIIFAAGNEENDGDCPPYPWDQISGPGGTAKNTIVVGATYSDTNGHTFFSSRGPTDDGRIKPDVSAPGDEIGGDGAIKSTLPGQSYGLMIGTSMSAPAAAGCAGLLCQDYRNTHGGANPTPATVKALLIHTAQDLGNVGPDYTYGWGLINVTAAVDVIRADNNPNQTIFQEQVNNSEVNAIYINVTPRTTKLKATLVWTDEPGAVAAAVELVNDLDLNVTNATTTFYPGILDPANPANPATTGIDSINNVEQVVIDEPAPGTHTVFVNGTSVPEEPQPFTLIVTVEKAAEPRIEANKTVWNPVNKTWVEEITANISDILTFRCEIHNSGTCCNLTNITVTDNLSDSLEYKDNATVNGEPWEPMQIGNKYQWEFPEWLFEPCETITIEFDAHVVKCGYGWNEQFADAWCEETEEWVYDEERVNITVLCVAPKPFINYGYVFCGNGSECINPSVNITNLNTSKQWEADTNASYNYYQLILDTTRINTGNVLEFYATDKERTQCNILYHTVTQSDVDAGGLFNFNITLNPFNIAITSPENKTYASVCVRLNFTVEPEGTTLDLIGYSLDGGANVTIAGNTTVSGLSACGHNIVVYARDSNGNTAASNLVYFTLHPGDINGDRAVNVCDLQRMAWAFGSSPGSASWNEDADLNCDNKVNVCDLQILAWNFGNDYTVIC